ncbi:hypothetical protein SAMN02745116_00730 [Pilibacter termitis]|uniref:DUF7916 domain-containing protein n=1 Tax=Pilibacter termitis TaxID=263852 RepID=A0A1T4LN29_9ENTE|nr:hypothetical protein [Pilibacter termitis]SJZ56017.1 hypothetical protein SAMN02745116_00730 [Pilibacter termitis]
MNRILACVASDFGKKETPLELKQAIKASEGRVILAEVAAETPSLFPEVTSGELATAFGADLILLKGFDVSTGKIASLPEVQGKSPVETLRELTGVAVGINLEITDDGIDSKRATASSIQQALAMKPDFLALTGYQKPEVTAQRILKEIQEVRKQYAGFLFVNPVIAHASQLNKEDLLAYAKAGADLIVLPAPATVPGVSEALLAEVAISLQKAGALVSATISTSQEGSDTDTIRSIALSAKRAGVDVYGLGDAGVAGMATPEAIQTLSIAVRGKRHTYVRMARSARR